MQKRKVIPALILTLAILSGITVWAGAAAKLQEISAYLTNDTVKYNGEVQTMLDSSGNRVYPINYNGSTYLPLRAVANMLGVPVDWDAETRTALLGDPEDGVDLIETFEPYTSYTTTGVDQFVQNSNKMSANAGGVDISHWIGFKYDGWIDNTRTISFNLGGKYSSLTFQVYADVDTLLTVKGDNGSVLGEYNLVGGQVPQTFTVNLMYTTQLSFVREGHEHSTCYIFDTVLK